MLFRQSFFLLCQLPGPLWLRITSAANRVTEYAGDSGVYILTREEWSEITAGRNIQMDISRIVWRNAFDSYYTAKSFEWLPGGRRFNVPVFLIAVPFALGGFAADSTAGEYKNSPLNERI